MNNFSKKFNRWNYYERRADNEYNKQTYHLEGNVYNFGIADINFQSPRPIINAIVNRAKKGTYSYSYNSDLTINAISLWYKKHHNLTIQNDWIRIVHGTTNAMTQIVQAFTEVGDKVLLQTPIYKPFSEAILHNDRIIIENKLIESYNTYSVDFEDFENKIKENNIKLFMLCNPHNPGAVVWDEETLNKISIICKKYNVVIFSDEVHSDITYKKFTSLINYADYNDVVIANSPNKAFNLGGLKASLLIIKDKKLQKIVDKQYEKNHLTSANVFINNSFQSAYLDSESYIWLGELREYIWGNYLYFKRELEQLNFKVFDLNTTYLVWIKLPFKAKLLVNYLHQNNIVICDHTDFYGAEDTFIRINIATQRNDLKHLIKILKDYGN